MKSGRAAQVILLTTLVAAARSEVNSNQQAARFPPGAIVDPQLYDRPHQENRPLDRPPFQRPQLGLQDRPPYGNRGPYAQDGPYAPGNPYYGPNDGRPPYKQGRPPYSDGRPPYGDGRPPYGDGDGRPPFEGDRPPYGRPYRPPPPQGYGGGYGDQSSGFGALNPLGGLSNALGSIAKYDDKQCVARMLCEMSAGGRPGSGYYRGSGGLFDLSGLSGIADLLGAMTSSPASSPMFTFGRAALLGATMRDPYRCYRSFPNCPRDPDRLVDYLNNHNGGFFRLFDGNDHSSSAASGNQDYPTRRPPYYGKSDDNFRKGKQLDEGKKETRESDSTSSNLVNPRILNDLPLIGERPIEAEPEFGKPYSKRPVRDPKAIRFDRFPAPARDEPTRFTLPLYPSSPFFPGPATNRSAKTIRPNSPSNYIPAPSNKPLVFFAEQATPRPQTTPRPVVHLHYHDDDYYSDYSNAPNPDFSDDYPINDKVEPLTSGGSGNSGTPYPHTNRELLDVYQRPSRVLYADSSRRGNNRNPKFVSQSDFKFPAQYRN